MLGVLQGFGIVGLIIGLGFVLAHSRFVDLADQQTLTKVAFYVATPALLVGMVSDADLHRVFGRDFTVHLTAAIVTGAVAVLIWRLVFRAPAAETTMGAINSVYSNSVNLGLPIAVYALSDATAIIPLLVLQLAVLQPVLLAALDVTTASGRFSLRRLLRPLRNPLIIATAVGMLLAATGWELPKVLGEPLRLVGAMSVPMILLAFGMSLCLGPKIGAGGSWGKVATAVVLKLVFMPLVAGLVGAVFFGAQGHALLTVAVVAALPTAQNVFGFAAAYRTAENFARDAIFATTLLSVPAVLAITALLG